MGRPVSAKRRGRDGAPWGSAALVSLSLAGTVFYVFVMNSVNLPETIWAFIGAGAALGVLVGRWWILCASLATWSMALSSPVGGEELEGYILYVYLPLAAASIGMGVAVRRVAWRILASRFRRRGEARRAP